MAGNVGQQVGPLFRNSQSPHRVRSMIERDWGRRWLIDVCRRHGWRLIDVHLWGGWWLVDRRGPGLGRNKHRRVRRNLVAVDATRRRLAFGIGTRRFVFRATDVPRRPTPHFFSLRTGGKRFVSALRDLSVEWVGVVLGSFWLHLRCLREPGRFRFKDYWSTTISYSTGSQLPALSEIRKTPTFGGSAPSPTIR